MERAATHLQQSRGEHAAALDLMRWAEANNLQVQFAELGPGTISTIGFCATAEERQLR